MLVLLESVAVAIKCCLRLINFLIHHAKINIGCCDFRMIITTYELHNSERAVHISERKFEVATRLVVHRESRVVSCDLRMIESEQPLQQNYRTCLEFNCLQEITEFELDCSDLNNTVGNVFSHRTGDL